MLFRIKAGDREFYLVRASERPVIKLAHEKSRGLPIGEKVAVFRGDKLIAEITRLSLFPATIGCSVAYERGASPTVIRFSQFSYNSLELSDMPLDDLVERHVRRNREL